MSLFKRRRVNLTVPLTLESSHTDTSPPSPRSWSETRILDGILHPGHENLSRAISTAINSSATSVRSYHGTPPPSSCEHTGTPDSPVEFRDRRLFNNPNVSTETFLGHFDLIPSDQNGTVFSNFTTSIISPQKSFRAMAGAAHRQARSVDWKAVTKTFGSLANNASSAISDRLNHALEGRDAVAVLNKAQDCLPKMPIIPTKRKLEKMVDDVGDVVQNMLPCHPSMSSLPMNEFRGSHLRFSRLVGEKARIALVKQRICREWQIMSTRENVEGWQLRLNQALTCVYEDNKSVYGIDKLMEVKPLWVGNKAENTWSLVLETDSWELATDQNGLYLEQIATDFELRGEGGWTSVRDFMRSSSPTPSELSWEEVEW